jgi:hypothetical protein
MPAEQGNDAERFAAALELGGPLGSADDELRRDLEIVAMLRSREAAFAPDPDAKARAKQRLIAALTAEQGSQGGRRRAEEPTAQEQTGRISPLAISSTLAPSGGAPRHDAEASAITAKMDPIDDEPDTIEHATPVPASARPGRRGRHTMPSRPSRSAGSKRPEARGLRRRAVLVGAAALVFMIALTGGGAFASRDALPGDNLYAMKRATETAETALTFGDEAKAHRHLQVAAKRLDEVEKLVSRQQTITDPELVEKTMKDFDSATSEGTKRLLAAQENAAALADLRAWAGEQVARLSALRSALPPSTQPEADESIDFLDRLLSRAAQLEKRANCTEVTSGEVDEIGPLPAQGPCDAKDSTKSKSTDSKDDEDSTKKSDSSKSSKSSGSPSGSATPSQNGPLPGLLPDLGKPVPDKVGTGSATPTTSAGKSSGGGDISVPVPLPMVPPITLPPLLPGQPGITIG